jgi:hypothetical protein
VNLHNIRHELTDQEKAIRGLDFLNPGQYDCTITPEGDVIWDYLPERSPNQSNTGILNQQYFIEVYDTAVQRGQIHP